MKVLAKELYPYQNFVFIVSEFDLLAFFPLSLILIPLPVHLNPMSLLYKNLLREATAHLSNYCQKHLRKEAILLG